MYEFVIVSLFPELFERFIDTSLIGRAKTRGLLNFRLMNPRSFTHDRHRTVDDTPYGGGAGMLMKVAPILELFDAAPDCHRVLMTPQGKPFVQADARRLAAIKMPLMIFCGRYEGLDDRVAEMFDEQLSMGDFVMNGGEVSAMAVIEAVSRLLPGILGNGDSAIEESFTNGLLEYPQYTRPEEIDGRRVPGVLLSGNHKEIARWRKGQSLLRTWERRPDLFARYQMNDEERALFEAARTARSSDEA